MMSVLDLQPVITARPVGVRKAGAAFYMLVDANGMNCVRHKGDAFPLIMDHGDAKEMFEDIKRDGKAGR